MEYDFKNTVRLPDLILKREQIGAFGAPTFQQDWFGWVIQQEETLNARWTKIQNDVAATLSRNEPDFVCTVVFPGISIGGLDEEENNSLSRIEEKLTDHACRHAKLRQTGKT